MSEFKHIGESIRKIPEISPDKLVKPDFVCPKCDGYGNIITPQGARPCDCIKKEINTDLLFREANIPIRFKNKNFDTYQTHTKPQQYNLNRMKTFVKNFSRKNNRGLYICGTNGVGKTHLSISVLKELLLKGYEGYYYNVTDLINNIKASFRDQEMQDSHSLMDDLINMEILVLDDLGLQKMSTYVADRLYALINGRYEKGNTLIVTSQDTPNELEMKLEYALCSRLYEMCSIYDCAGSDFRKSTSEAKTQIIK